MFQLNAKQRRTASIAAIGGAVLIGAVAVVLKTYPHLNPFSCKKDQQGDEEKESKGEEPQAAEETSA
ncbi:hypothetical protein DAMA08_022410 [Martiniozyma asiatica (nom. inval.)]|nr:hypothetical protein DAMA08_022410 [Martiniozyma asiatica]